MQTFLPFPQFVESARVLDRQRLGKQRAEAKAPEWYGQFGWSEAPAQRDAKGRYPYIWPVPSYWVKCTLLIN